MKYYLIAGEPSGDLHAAHLMKSVLQYDQNAEFRFYGGDNMKEVGGVLVKHYSDLAIMGIWEVFKSLKKLTGFIEECKKDIAKNKPDVVILIDYSGFNLRIARFVKSISIPVYYYITPKLWAWGKSRAVKIRKYVDKVYVILPFEVDFFKNLSIHAEFYGNPVVDQIDSFCKSYTETKEQFLIRNQLENKPIIALLAGSRKQEIDLCLPEMMKAIRGISDYQFVIAGSPSIPKEYYFKFTEFTNVRLVYDETYALLKNSHTAIVTSGTATLETALIKIPQVVVYKTSRFTFYFGQILILIGVIHVKFFSLVNIILDRSCVKELLQFNLADNIRKELNKLIGNKEYRKSVIAGYEEVQQILGGLGTSSRVADKIVNSLMKR